MGFGWVYNLKPDKHSVNNQKRGKKKKSLTKFREDVSCFSFFSSLIERINSSSPLFLTKYIEYPDLHSEDQVNWCVRRANPHQISLLPFSDILFLILVVVVAGIVLVASWSVTMCLLVILHVTRLQTHHSMRMNYLTKSPPNGMIE